MAPLQKVKLAKAADPDRDFIEFDFNPEDISYTVSMQARSARNQGSRSQQSTQGAANTSETGSDQTHEATVTVTPSPSQGPQMMFKTVFVKWDGKHPAADPGTVKTRVRRLMVWTKPLKPSDNKDLKDGKKKAETAPPELTFTWGTAFTGLQCHLTKVTAKFIRFEPSGEPTAAVVDMTLTEVPTSILGQNPTSGGLAPIRGHLVRAGDSLPSIAFATYGHARYWRSVALANDIDDPMRVRPGTMLRLPTMAELEGGP